MSLRPDDPRMAGLRNAANEAKAQGAAIQEMLKQYSDEEIERELDRNESLREFLSIDADKDNSGIIVNYANQPQNGQQSFSFSPTWGVPAGGYMQTPYNGGGYYCNNFMAYQNADERVKMYNNHPGMRLYNLSPYAFLDADQLLDYYNYLEKEREKQVMLNYVLLTFGCAEDDREWADCYKFKSADDIVKEQIEARQKAEEERRKELYGDEEGSSNKTVYDVYDANGYVIRRDVSFTIYDAETGEVERVVSHKKDENGKSYSIHTYAEEQKEALEIGNFYNEIYKSILYRQNLRNILIKQYNGNLDKWNSWREQGLSQGEINRLLEEERVDWVAHERAISRALQTTSYSRKKFNEILSAFYDTEFKWSNKSKFFNLSYDWARDLRYKELTSTPEEMENDPLVHQKLQEEYEIKRKIFMERAMTGNLKSDCGLLNLQNRPALPKPNLDTLTLEDFQKPENHIMYNDLSAPELHTDNLFIPDLKNMSPEEILRRNGVQLDENGQVIPTRRTITNVTVDDDTGQIIAQQSYDVPPECYNPNMRQASDDMTDEELATMF